MDPQSSQELPLDHIMSLLNPAPFQHPHIRSILILFVGEFFFASSSLTSVIILIYRLLAFVSFRSTSESFLMAAAFVK
jgi:hypothetical protein